MGKWFSNIEENVHYFPRFQYGKDILYTNEGNSNYAYYQNTYHQQLTQFFLDRAIYRPGQTVYFKGLAFEKKGRFKAKHIGE